MSSTALDHRLVRDYLRELDTAMRGLPPTQARELREQITAHLDDAIHPGADDQAVAAILSRLGSPADLAGEAGAGTAAPRAPSLRVRLARRSWRFRTNVAASLILVLAAAGYVIAIQTASELQVGPTSSWWDVPDGVRAVDTTADGVSQTAIPIRSGQRQGMAVDLYNPTDWTQTIVGPAVGPNIEWNSPGSATVQLGVSRPNWAIDHGGMVRNVSFTLPGSIPPHQIRLLRITWISNVCMQEAGDAGGIDRLTLRVRIGWITRIETIPLGEGWYLSGPSQIPFNPRTGCG